MIKVIGYPKDKKIVLLYGGKYDKNQQCWLFPDYLEDMVRTKLGFSNESIVKINNIKNQIFKASPFNLFKIIPFKHQENAFFDSLMYEGYALFCDTGTGKTKIAIDNVNFRFNNKIIDKCLVICPKSGLDVWEKEIQKNSDLSYMNLYDKNPDLRKKKYYNDFLNNLNAYNVGITNYDSLLILGNDFLTTVNKKWMLIFDESTWVKSPKAMRTKLAMKLSLLAGYRMILSGTPITNNILDIFSQWYIVDGGSKFGFSWYKFREYWFIPGYMQWKWTPKEELYKYVEESIESGSFRIKKEDCLDLPDKIYEERYIEMDEVQSEKYNSMVKELFVQLENQEVSVNTILAQMVKLQQISNGFIYDENKKAIRISDGKVNAVRELIEENPEANIIIWVYFREDMEYLYKKLLSDSKHVHIMDSNNVNSTVCWFQNSNIQSIIISNPQSCGYSITLTKADIVIYYSNSFKAIERYQSEDRVHRIGLNHKVVYIDLITKGTIDEKVKNLLLDKKNLLSEILDYKKFLGR